MADGNVSPRYEVHVTYGANYKNPRLRGKTKRYAHAIGGVPMEQVTPDLVAQQIHEMNMYPGAEKITVSEVPLTPGTSLKAALTSPKPSIGALPPRPNAVLPAATGSTAVSSGPGRAAAPLEGAEPANAAETASEASETGSTPTATVQ